MCFKGWLARIITLQLFSIKRFTMSYFAVLYVQTMWKCDYKLLKAQKQTVNRNHHKNTVGWKPFDEVLKQCGYRFDTWCYHVKWKAKRRFNIKRLITLVYDKHFKFYQKIKTELKRRVLPKR